MNVISYSEARNNLKSVLDRVVDDCEEAVITRRNGEAVVMISLSEWNSIRETEHLLSNPENARRLRRGIEQFNAGKGLERELVWP